MLHPCRGCLPRLSRAFWHRSVVPPTIPLHCYISDIAAVVQDLCSLHPGRGSLPHHIPAVDSDNPARINAFCCAPAVGQDI